MLIAMTMPCRCRAYSSTLSVVLIWRGWNTSSRIACVSMRAPVFADEHGQVDGGFVIDVDLRERRVLRDRRRALRLRQRLLHGWRRRCLFVGRPRTGARTLINRRGEEPRIGHRALLLRLC